MPAERKRNTKYNGVCRTGTSGIVLPGPKKTFPKEFVDKTRLQYYAHLFSTLEINSSFYKLPMPATFAKWAQDVPRHFKFTVKVWRNITHAKKLAFKDEDIRQFMQALQIPAYQKGCLLLQFPAGISYTYYNEVEKLITKILAFDTGLKWRLAIEFRHSSWYNEHTYRLLDQYDASLVLHDMPASKTALLNKGAQFVYIRLHGCNGDYRGSYNDEWMETWSEKIKSFIASGRDVYVYFNNTLGDAFENARQLDSLTGKA